MTLHSPVDDQSPTADADPAVTELMTTRLVGITPDAPVSTALHLMARSGVRHLPVMDGQRCLGLVVEVDLVGVLARGGPLESGFSRLVGEITRTVHDLPVTARRSDVARHMQSDTSDAVLVIDHGQVLGIVTASDLIRSLAPG
ncbi:MAG: CBS domain-containing protein [Pseudonocardia sp.]|nr:CBS domain-containing protein [Pseudonocardia sp.]